MADEGIHPLQASDILLRDLVGDGNLRLTLNDTRRRNALSEPILTDLCATFAAAGANPAVRIGQGIAVSNQLANPPANRKLIIIDLEFMPLTQKALALAGVKPFSK